MKVSPEAAHYRVINNLNRSCHNCEHRIDNGAKPSTCTRITGTVDPQHICDYWHSDSFVAKMFSDRRR